MPNKCRRCKQTKPCRKKRLYSNGAGVGYPIMYLGSEWRCKDCDDYFLNEIKELRKKSKIDKEKRTKEFIIKRDKKLKEIRK